MILTLFLSKTVYGGFLYAIGGNEKSSFIAGLNVSRYKIFAYVLCGALAGFAGVVLASRMGSAQAKAGLDRFKMEAAREVGVNLKEGYNGDLTSRENGSVGGQMVKRMVEAYEKNL